MDFIEFKNDNESACEYFNAKIRATAPRMPIKQKNNLKNNKPLDTKLIVKMIPSCSHIFTHFYIRFVCCFLVYDLCL